MRELVRRHGVRIVSLAILLGCYGFADGRYYDLAPELGLDQPMVSRGIAVGDAGDGDLDFAVGNQWQTSYSYRNAREREGIQRRVPATGTGRIRA